MHKKSTLAVLGNARGSGSQAQGEHPQRNGEDFLEVSSDFSRDFCAQKLLDSGFPIMSRTNFM